MAEVFLLGVELNHLVAKYPLMKGSISLENLAFLVGLSSLAIMTSGKNSVLHMPFPAHYSHNTGALRVKSPRLVQKYSRLDSTFEPFLNSRKRRLEILVRSPLLLTSRYKSVLGGTHDQKGSFSPAVSSMPWCFPPFHQFVSGLRDWSVLHPLQIPNDLCQMLDLISRSLNHSLPVSTSRPHLHAQPFGITSLSGFVGFLMPP
jgi:hypothetical protein